MMNARQAVGRVVLIGWFFTVCTPINFNVGPFATQKDCEQTRPNYIKSFGVSPRCFGGDAETPKTLGKPECPSGGDFQCR